MKPFTSVNFRTLARLSVLIISFSLGSCLNGTFSSDAPGTQQRLDLSAIERSATARATNDTAGYVFSYNYFTYNPCLPPAEACPYTLYVGNPVHAYTFDLISGMPTPKGIQVEIPPVNTKSVVASPGGRYMYMLTGDRLYTFSIGFAYFTEAEFANLNPLDLYNAIISSGYISGTASSAADIVAQLNMALQRADLYDKLLFDNRGIVQSAELTSLKTSTQASRAKLFSALPENDQKSIVRLNRLMLELVYPNITPQNKGTNAQHQVGEPLVLPGANPPSFQDMHSPIFPRYKDDVYAHNSIVMDPLGRFVYVVRNSTISVYARDVVSGQLTSLATQSMGDSIYRFVISTSGEFAYGSNNGGGGVRTDAKLHSYRINRNTGLLTEIGSPIAFRGWYSGDPYNNLAIDPAGKFIYLVASSGNPWIPPDIPGCNAVQAYYQMGSLVYTYVIDSKSGLLTLSGPPIDTTPHLVTAAAVDPLGRFVHLLNTHEHRRGPYVPDVCDPSVSTSQLRESAIYSYYVEPATGKLNLSGSLQAGGTSIPDGFVLGGFNSISLTADKIGKFVYLLNGGDIYVYTVDQANGALTVNGQTLTGATTTPVPGTYYSANNPSFWPVVCYTNGVRNTFCSFDGTSPHSFTWAGY